MSDHARLATMAALLLGEQWQRPLARLLGMDPRAVRRWAAGRPVPAWALERLESELRQEIKRLEVALGEADGEEFRP